MIFRKELARKHKPRLQNLATLVTLIYTRISCGCTLFSQSESSYSIDVFCGEASKNSLSGNDELFLSPRQIAKLQKAKKNNTGAEISFSKSAIRKSVKQGGSLWTSLLKLTPFLTKGVSKVAPHLATGALSALGSLGIDKIFGSGMQGGAVLPDAIVK